MRQQHLPQPAGRRRPAGCGPEPRPARDPSLGQAPPHRRRARGKARRVHARSVRPSAGERSRTAHAARPLAEPLRRRTALRPRRSRRPGRQARTPALERLSRQRRACRAIPALPGRRGTDGGPGWGAQPLPNFVLGRWYHIATDHVIGQAALGGTYVHGDTGAVLLSRDPRVIRFDCFDGDRLVTPAMKLGRNEEGDQDPRR
jgi:hypothetical protein